MGVNLADNSQQRAGAFSIGTASVTIIKERIVGLFRVRDGPVKQFPALAG